MRKLEGCVVDSPVVFDPGWSQVLFDTEAGGFVWRHTALNPETRRFETRFEEWVDVSEVAFELHWRNDWSEWMPEPLALEMVAEFSDELFVLMQLASHLDSVPKKWSDYLNGKRKHPLFPAVRSQKRKNQNQTRWSRSTTGGKQRDDE